MQSPISYSVRFREAREHAGLSHEEAALRMGISSGSLWDIETHEEELCACYSPVEVRQFCEVLGIRPADLFGFEDSKPPIHAQELAHLVRDICHSRSVTLSQFEDTVGWKLAPSLEEPVRLLQDLSIDGLKRICQELEVDWQKVIMSL